MKRIIPLLLALCLVIVLAVPAMAEDVGVCGDSIGWSLEGSTLTIDGSGKMYDFSEGGAPWEEHKDTITAVKFTGGVTYVGAYSFANYDNLTSVSFGSEMYELGTGSFKDCDGLTALSMPASFKIFGEDSLRSCDKLTRIDCAGRFPSFRSNSLWDTRATIYYPADKPWSADTIRELENAFSGRIEFRASDGTDPVKPTEPKPTEPKPTQPKPTQPQVTPTETETAPTWVTLEPTEGPTVTRFTLPPLTEPVEEEEENGGGFSGWLAVLLVIAVLAGFAAVTIYVQQAQQKKRRAQRRKRPDFE